MNIKVEVIKDENVEEYDISTEIWNKYKTEHPWNCNPNDKNRSTLYWNIENPTEEPIGKNIRRRYAYITKAGLEKYQLTEGCLFIKNEKLKLEDVRISGDIIFNFSMRASQNGGPDKQYEKYSKLLGSLSDEEKRKTYQKKLDYCKQKHHSPDNCALLLSTGNLQRIKKSIGDDRGDTFLWLLDSYFKGENEIILNHTTPELVGILKAFLDSFKMENRLSESIYNYCLNFYNVRDNIVDKLVRSGSKAIDTPERVCEYVDLAIEFWEVRGEFNE